MYSVKHYEEEGAGGSEFSTEEVRELEALNLASQATIRSIVEGRGAGAFAQTCRDDLIAQGRRWAQHVLEGPISWIMSAAYIAVTVTLGFTPLSAIYYVLTTHAVDDTISFGNGTSDYSGPFPAKPAKYIIGFIDAFIYTFLPWWTTVLLRLIQGRPWLHRVAGRSILIGDVPWVAQSAEAFLSKLFALSYSIASINVASANPLDHLVHRHTHRVVRGSLLAVGRPDGRLNALSAAENTVCLSVNQASSIQNYMVTCESITIGHNPTKLPLSANAIFLPRQRDLFFSEHVIEGVKGDESKEGTSRDSQAAEATSKALSAGALMGKLSGVAACQVDEDDNGINDIFDEVLDINKKMDKKDRRRRPTKEEMAEKGFRKIEPLGGMFIGSWMAWDEELRGKTNQELMDRQHLIQTLYETRCASLHRFISFLVMFHALGKTVMDFWPRVTCGIFHYDMSRTHSIMRIATTASPVSGMEVREKTLALAKSTAENHAKRMCQLFAASWLVRKAEENEDSSSSFIVDEDKVQAMMAILYQGGAQSFRKSASFRKSGSSLKTSFRQVSTTDDPPAGANEPKKSVFDSAGLRAAEALSPRAVSPRAVQFARLSPMDDSDVTKT